MHDGDFITRDIGLRVSKLDVTSDLQLRGYAIVFSSLSQDLGGFKERIAPGAVDRTLKSGVNVLALTDHKRDIQSVLGSTNSGSLKLSKDRYGLAVEINPPDTPMSRTVVANVKRGIVEGMSFAFRPFPDAQSGTTWTEEDDQLVRTVDDMVFSEVSIVLDPAYLQTEIAARNHALDLRAMQEFKQAMGWRPSLGLRERIARLTA